MFPSNRQKLKKRKCDLHKISSALPKAVVLNLFWAMDHFFKKIFDGPFYYANTL